MDPLVYGLQSVKVDVYNNCGIINNMYGKIYIPMLLSTVIVHNTLNVYLMCNLNKFIIKYTYI